MEEKPNLYQRIRAVALTVTSVEKTGKTQFNSKATSIGDVENALRGPMFECGVITRWGYVELTDLSNGKLWCCRLRVTVVNADNPVDQFEDEWTDVGTNPMAATSFARKGFLKALFHLTGDEDEAHAPTPETTRRTSGPRRQQFAGNPADALLLNAETGELTLGLDQLRASVRAAIINVAEAENREAKEIFNLAALEKDIVNPKGLPGFDRSELEMMLAWCESRLGVPA